MNEPKIEGMRLVVARESLRDANALERRLLLEARKRGPCDHFRLFGPIANGPWTTVFRGESDLYQVPVAVKLHWDPDRNEPDQQQALESVAALENAERLFRGDPEFLHVSLIDKFTGLGVVIADWVEGKTLERLVSRVHQSEGPAIIGMAGAWLARLHASGLREMRPLDTQRALSSLDTRREGAPTQKRTRATSRAYELLCASADRVAQEPVPWVLAHGDFKPSNLFFSAGRIVGIDAQLFYVDAAPFDAAHFLNHLAFRLSWQPLPFGRRRIERLESAFVIGYEQAGALKLPMRPLRWVRLLNTVRLVNWHSRSSRTPLVPLVLMRLEGVLHRLSVELCANRDSGWNPEP